MRNPCGAEGQMVGVHLFLLLAAPDDAGPFRHMEEDIDRRRVSFVSFCLWI